MGGLGSAFGILRYGAVLCACNIALAGVAAAETVTVAALGDSLTQGYGLPPEDGLRAAARGLAAGTGRGCGVINAGCPLATPRRAGLSRVAWTLTPEVDAMIVGAGRNDFLRGVDPSVEPGQSRRYPEGGRGAGRGGAAGGDDRLVELRRGVQAGVRFDVSRACRGLMALPLYDAFFREGLDVGEDTARRGAAG